MSHPSAQDTLRSAVIYCRVACGSDRYDAVGLETQRSRCADYATSNAYTVEKVFTDTTSGGEDPLGRPGMAALLAFLETQKDRAIVVIFDDLIRLSRDTASLVMLRRIFDAHGARPECLNFGFDETPDGALIETVIAAQNEQQGRRIKAQQPSTGSASPEQSAIERKAP